MATITKVYHNGLGVQCVIDDKIEKTPNQIRWDYVCADCGHALVEYDDPDVRCPNCGSHEIARRGELQQQREDTLEVMNGLPAELQAAVRHTAGKVATDPLWAAVCVGDDGGGGSTRKLPADIKLSKGD